MANNCFDLTWQTPENSMHSVSVCRSDEYKGLVLVRIHQRNSFKPLSQCMTIAWDDMEHFTTVKGLQFISGQMTLKLTQEIGRTTRVACSMKAVPLKYLTALVYLPVALWFHHWTACQQWLSSEEIFAPIFQSNQSNVLFRIFNGSTYLKCIISWGLIVQSSCSDMVQLLYQAGNITRFAPLLQRRESAADVMLGVTPLFSNQWHNEYYRLSCVIIFLDLPQIPSILAKLT